MKKYIFNGSIFRDSSMDTKLKYFGKTQSVLSV